MIMESLLYFLIFTVIASVKYMLITKFNFETKLRVQHLNLVSEHINIINPIYYNNNFNVIVNIGNKISRNFRSEMNLLNGSNKLTDNLKNNDQIKNTSMNFRYKNVVVEEHSLLKMNNADPYSIKNKYL